MRVFEECLLFESNKLISRVTQVTMQNRMTKTSIQGLVLLLHQFNETAQDGFGDVDLDGAVVGIGERQCLLDGADAEDEPQVDDVFSAKADELLLDMGYVRESLLYLAQSVGHHEVYGAGIEDVGVVVIGLHVDDLVQVDDVELVMSTET